MTGKARILFVDDEMRVLKSMRGLFRREFELFLTTEGSDAIRIAKENPIDVIVADQRMPGMNGTELLGKVKELSPNTVRILLTGYADPEAVEGSINIGEVFRFLSKPCSPKVLRETIQLAVAASRAAPVLTTRQAPANPRGVDHQTSPDRRRAHATYAPGDNNAPKPDAASSVRQATQVPVLRETASAGGKHAAKPSVARAGAGKLAAAALPQTARAVVAGATSQSVVPINRAVAQRVSEEETSSHWRNSTTVVLSGDTSHEFKAPNFGTDSAARFKDVGIVFFTVDPGFVETAMRAASTDRSVTLATSLAKVANTIEREGAGVLITDITANGAVLRRMINTLKQQLPALVTIVASDSRDTTDMINLINHGQVFRYILKPVEPKTLMYEINAAAIKHLDLLENPATAMRHQVSELHETAEPPETLNKFVSRIRALRSNQRRSYEPS